MVAGDLALLNIELVYFISVLDELSNVASATYAYAPTNWMDTPMMNVMATTFPCVFFFNLDF